MASSILDLSCCDRSLRSVFGSSVAAPQTGCGHLWVRPSADAARARVDGSWSTPDFTSCRDGRAVVGRRGREHRKHRVHLGLLRDGRRRECRRDGVGDVLGEEAEGLHAKLPFGERGDVDGAAHPLPASSHSPAAPTVHRRPETHSRPGPSGGPPRSLSRLLHCREALSRHFGAGA